MRFASRLVTGESGSQAAFAGALFEERKDLVSPVTKHFVAAQTRDLLHRPIPRHDPELAIKRVETIDAGVEQAL